ncbi:MAG: hypothetical protein WC678_03835 [Parcubacteria group bacterium]|jgi:hypothetical protein
MNLDELKEKIITIVAKCTELKNQNTNELNAPVNYACIFSHSEDEFELLISLANGLGSVISETPTGPIFSIETISTVAGDLKLLKIRKPFENKPQLGYADFTLNNYLDFKKKYLAQEKFKLTVRENYEMIGLEDSTYNVLTYFAYPPLDEQLGVK